MNNDFCKLINLKKRLDNRGNIIILENNKEIPFDINRIFYIYGVEKDIVRGNHANLESKMVFICINGSCKIDIDNGNKKKEFLLNSPDIALFADKLTWKKMLDFTPDCILLIITNTFYNPDDYITDYNRFLEIIKKNK